MSAAISFAFAAGLLATVNPCGFALLPSFLTVYLGEGQAEGEQGALSRLAEGLAVGAVLSFAFGAVFVVVGLAVAAGLRFALQAIPWLALGIGAGLLALGLAMLLGRHVGLLAASRVRVDAGPGSGYRRVAAFGATYALASLSCTLAVFLVVVGQALAVANPLQLLAVFAAYAAGSASLLIALAVSAALARGALARGVRRFAPKVNRLAGALVLLSGAYLIAYWLPAVGGGRPASDSWAARSSAQVTSSLADFFAAHTGAFAILLAVFGAIAVGVVVQRTAPGALHRR